MKKIMFYNADEGECAKAILAGCYKFGVATLLRRGGATMTSVIEYDDKDYKTNRMIYGNEGKGLRIEQDETRLQGCDI